MIIRKARLSDAENLAEMYTQFWEYHKDDPLIELEKKISIKNQVEFAKKDIIKKNVNIFVAVIDNNIVGFIEVLMKKNDKCFKIKEYGYLNSAVTHKDYRRQGIARVLDDFALKFLRKKNIKYIKTNVYNSNKNAVETWKKLGFKPLSTIMIKKTK